MQADVTVVVPVLNGERTLSRALLSVLYQSLPVTKVIIINDNSSDGTGKIIDDFQLKFMERNIEFVSINNSARLGPGLARNLGIQRTYTRYIAFLDADDTWHRDKIRLQYDFMERNLEYLMSCHSSVRPHETTSGKDQDLYFKKLLFRNIVATRTVMLRTEPKLYFNTGLSEDFELWLRVLASDYRGRFLSSPVAYHFKPDFSKNGISGRLFLHEAWELRRLIGCLENDPQNSLVIIMAVLFSVVKFFRRLAIRFVRTALQREA
jgi:glycosyltransferase involved in cell wall biosynthesis